MAPSVDGVERVKANRPPSARSGASALKAAPSARSPEPMPVISVYWKALPLLRRALCGTPPAQAQPLRPALEGVLASCALPLARSAHDIALALHVLSSPLTAMTPMGRVPLAWRERGTPPQRCRVAVIVDDAQAEVDTSLQQALLRLADFMRDAGVSVSLEARPVDSEEAHDVYLHLLRAATGSHYDEASYAAAQAAARPFDSRVTSQRGHASNGGILRGALRAADWGLRQCS